MTWILGITFAITHWSILLQLVFLRLCVCTLYFYSLAIQERLCFAISVRGLDCWLLTLHQTQELVKRNWGSSQRSHPTIQRNNFGLRVPTDDSELHQTIEVLVSSSFGTGVRKVRDVGRRALRRDTVLGTLLPRHGWWASKVVVPREWRGLLRWSVDSTSGFYFGRLDRFQT